MTITSATSLYPGISALPSSTSASDPATVKLDLALAQSASYKNINGGILASLGSFLPSADTGLSSSLIYQIYDSKAVTTAILESYKKKVDAASADTAASASTDTAPAQDTAAATTPADATPPAEDATAQTYQPQISDGRGYDAAAVAKYYDWFSNPDNVYKTYDPASQAGSVNLQA